jgi:hypothetical protein
MMFAFAGLSDAEAEREFFRTVLLGLALRAPFLPFATMYAYDAFRLLHMGISYEWIGPWRLLGFLQIPVVVVGMVRAGFWSQGRGDSKTKSCFVVGAAYCVLTLLTNVVFCIKPLMVYLRGALA